MPSTNGSDDLLVADIGGTYLRVQIKEKLIEHSSNDLDIEAYLNDLIERYRISRAAVSFAGQVCCNRILFAPNIRLRTLRLRVPKLIIENDLNCAAIAEANDHRTDSLVALYSGTGLGAGIVEKGELVRGFYNLAGEIGHVPFKKSPFRCGCGKDNCYELFASGKALKLWSEYFGCQSDLRQTCEEVRSLYLQALTAATATLLTLCNPRILVLGGGVIKNNPNVVEYVKKNIGGYAPSFALHKSRIVTTKLENASLLGARILGERL